MTNPTYWILPVLAILVVLAWNAPAVEAATVNLTVNSTYSQNLTNGTGVWINLSMTDLNNVTACVLNFTSAARGDRFAVNLTNGEGGATVGPGQGPTISRGFLNFTSLQHNLNFTGRLDADDWTITGTCWNHTASGANSTAGGVGSWNESITQMTFRIDNSTPDAPTGLLTTNTEADKVALRATVLPQETTQCVVWVSNSGGAYTSYNMTHAVNDTSCTMTLNNLYDPGDLLRIFVEASDGTNKTNSSVTTIELDGKGSIQTTVAARNALLVEAARQANLVNDARQAEVTQTTSTNTKWLLGGALVLVVLGYYQGWFGKKRR